MRCSLLWRFWHWQYTGLWNHRLNSAPALLPVSRQGLPTFGCGLKVCNHWKNIIIHHVISRESGQALGIRYAEHSCWSKLSCHKTMWWSWGWTKWSWTTPEWRCLTPPHRHLWIMARKQPPVGYENCPRWNHLLSEVCVQEEVRERNKRPSRQDIKELFTGKRALSHSDTCSNKIHRHL